MVFFNAQIDFAAQTIPGVQTHSTRKPGMAGHLGSCDLPSHSRCAIPGDAKSWNGEAYEIMRFAQPFQESGIWAIDSDLEYLGNRPLPDVIDCPATPGIPGLIWAKRVKMKIYTLPSHYQVVRSGQTASGQNRYSWDDNDHDHVYSGSQHG